MYIHRRSNILNTRTSPRATSLSSSDTPKYVLGVTNGLSVLARTEFAPNHHQLAVGTKAFLPLKKRNFIESNLLSWDNDTRDVKTVPREDALKRARESSDFVSSAQAQVLWDELEADFGALPQLEDGMPYDELEAINAVGVEHCLALTPVNDVASLQHASLDAAKQLYAGSFDHTAHVSSESHTRDDEDVPMDDALEMTPGGSRQRDNMGPQEQALWDELEADFGALPQLEDAMLWDELDADLRSHPLLGGGIFAMGFADYTAANDVASLDHAFEALAKQVCAGFFDNTAHISSEDVPKEYALKKGRESSDQCENMDFVECEQAQVLWNELETDLGALPPLEDATLMFCNELEANHRAEWELKRKSRILIES